MATAVPVYTLDLPEYKIDSKPDYAAIGPKIDRFIETHFPGRRIALRGIFLDDHPDLSRDQLVATILELGTDRYDPERKSMHHEHYAEIGVDIHAVSFEVTDRLRALEDEDYIAAPSPMGEFATDFFESALAERGYSLRMDILIAYDLDQLVAVHREYLQGYAFRDPTRKQAALLGLVNILREDESAT